MSQITLTGAGPTSPGSWEIDDLFGDPLLWAAFEAQRPNVAKASDVGSVCADGAPVGYLEDISGSGHHLRQGAWMSGTDAQRPTFNANGGDSFISFNGSQGLFNTLGILSGRMTVVVVGKFTSAPAPVSYFELWAIDVGGGGDSLSRQLHINNIGGYTSISNLASGGSGSYSAGTDWTFDLTDNVWCTVMNGGLPTWRTTYNTMVNNAQNVMNESGALIKNTIGMVGGSSMGGGLSNGMIGNIEAMYIFSDVITPALQRKLNDYINRTYNRALSTARQRNIVCLGDSITYGYLLTGAEAWPEQMRPTLAATSRIWNIGIPNQTSSEIITNVSNKEVKYYDDDATKNIAVVFIGSNDLGVAGGNISGAALHANVTSIVSTLKARGFTVIVSSVLPRTYAADAGGFETRRQDFRNLTISSLGGDKCGADYEVDLAADVNIGIAGSQDNLTYYLPDKIHPTAAGYAIIASRFKTVIDSI